jgi:hypothetical protein
MVKFLAPFDHHPPGSAGIPAGVLPSLCTPTRIVADDVRSRPFPGVSPPSARPPTPKISENFISSVPVYTDMYPFVPRLLAAPPDYCLLATSAPFQRARAKQGVKRCQKVPKGVKKCHTTAPPPRGASRLSCRLGLLSSPSRGKTGPFMPRFCATTARTFVLRSWRGADFQVADSMRE